MACRKSASARGGATMTSVFTLRWRTRSLSV
jgi:hypothetical protein